MYREQYPYLYETHLHTSMGSACARSTPQEMVRAAKQAGYSGVFITEHNWLGNSCVNKNLPWRDWIDRMARSYYAAKELGDEIGLSVFFAYEAGFFELPSSGAEFLIYGLTPQWLQAHPELRHMDAPEHLRLVRSAGAMAVHAHPFRWADYIPRVHLLPDDIDAVEAINATHSNSRYGAEKASCDEQAIDYARTYGFPMTAGSDIHTSELLGGGVAFRRPIVSERDYCNAILHGEDYILTNGESVYNKQGNLLPGSADWA